MAFEVGRVYEDFEPHVEWAYEAGCDILIAYLPGFQKEHLKVQVTSAQQLRILGERKIGDNKWSRFRKEVPIPSNCDTNKITANFTGGILVVKHPHLIIPEAVAEPEKPEPSKQVPKQGDQEQPAKDLKPPTGTTASDQQKPADEPQKQKINGEEKAAAQGLLSKDTMEKKENGKTEGMAKANGVPADLKETNGKTGKTEATPDASKTMEKEKKNDLADDGLVKAKSSKEKRGISGDSVRDAEEENKRWKGITGAVNGSGRDKHQQERAYLQRQVITGWIKELKNPKKLMNLAVAVLLLVVLTLYVIRAFRFLLGNSEPPEPKTDF